MIRVSERNAIEWTPNTIASRVNVEGDLVHIALESETPNLKTYQMKKLPDGAWEDVDASVKLEVNSNREEVAFRVVNLADVAGPEYKITIGRGADEISSK